jgi:hypothetical protein
VGRSRLHDLGMSPTTASVADVAAVRSPACEGAGAMLPLAIADAPFTLVIGLELTIYAGASILSGLGWCRGLRRR